MQQTQDSGSAGVWAGRSELPFQLVMDWTGRLSDWHFDVRLVEEKWVRAGQGRVEAATVEEAQRKVQAAFNAAYQNLDLNALRAKHGLY